MFKMTVVNDTNTLSGEFRTTFLKGILLDGLFQTEGNSWIHKRRALNSERYVQQSLQEINLAIYNHEILGGNLFCNLR